MARKNESPQKAAMREMMKGYLKENDISIKDGTDVNAVMRDMMSVLLEGVPDQEPDEELGYSKYDYRNKDTDNSRNGHSTKTMHTSYGDMEMAVPRDRNGDYEPQLIKKYLNTVTQDMEEKILSMYAKGMTTGEKIKHFRNLRGISQETLGQLSGINSATIKKYEYGIRNPKPDQLLKIANALGISINVFMDFDIETVSDVLSLILKMDEQLDMNFEAERYEDGSFNPATIKISFKNSLLNHKLGVYMKARELQENLLNDTERFSSEEEHQRAIEALSKDLDAVKQSILDDSKIVKKGVRGISVKIYPENE